MTICHIMTALTLKSYYLTRISLSDQKLQMVYYHQCHFWLKKTFFGQEYRTFKPRAVKNCYIVIWFQVNYKKLITILTIFSLILFKYRLNKFYLFLYGVYWKHFCSNVVINVKMYVAVGFVLCNRNFRLTAINSLCNWQNDNL